jgi:solute carrier family 35 protein F5
LALVGDVVFKNFIPGLQYAIGATFVVAGFFVVNMATLSDVDESAIVHQRNIIDDLEGEEQDRFDEFDTETNQRRMARVLSISEHSNNYRRTSNCSVLSAHP